MNVYHPSSCNKHNWMLMESSFWLIFGPRPSSSTTSINRQSKPDQILSVVLAHVTSHTSPRELDIRARLWSANRTSEGLSTRSDACLWFGRASRISKRIIWRCCAETTSPSVAASWSGRDKTTSKAQLHGDSEIRGDCFVSASTWCFRSFILVRLQTMFWCDQEALDHYWRADGY